MGHKQTKRLAVKWVKEMSADALRPARTRIVPDKRKAECTCGRCIRCIDRLDADELAHMGQD